jgi:hypothetical protein
MGLGQEDRMTCEVDLATKKIRFDCEDHAAQRTAAEKRIAQLSSMMGAPSGWTSRERREMSRERNILRAWLSPNTYLKRCEARGVRILAKRYRAQGFYDKELTQREEKAWNRKAFRKVQKLKRRIAAARDTRSQAQSSLLQTLLQTSNG